MSGLLSKRSYLEASLVGLEPTTPCLEGRCSVRLSYRDECLLINVSPETKWVKLARLATQYVIASPSLPVILSVAKNLMVLRTGSAKQSHTLTTEIASSLVLLAMTNKHPRQISVRTLNVPSQFSGGTLPDGRYRGQ